MRRVAAAAFVLTVAAGVVEAARAYFTARQTSPQTIQAVTDFLPPTISSSAVYASVLGIPLPGVVQLFPYNVYAQVADQGNPAAGVSTVTANVSSIGGPANLTLTPGSYRPLGQTTYNYGSAAQNAPVLILGSTKPYSITAGDAVNSPVTQNYTVTVVSSSGGGGGGAGTTATGVSAPNGGARPLAMDAGDRITYSFSTKVDASSIVPGWSGSGSPGPMTVKLKDHGHDDTITVWNGSTQTPLGTIDTEGDYVSEGTVAYNGTLIQSGHDIILTIDTSPSGAATADGPTKMTWTPGNGITSNGSPVATTPTSQPSAVNNF